VYLQRSAPSHHQVPPYALDLARDENLGPCLAQKKQSLSDVPGQRTRALMSMVIQTDQGLMGKTGSEDWKFLDVQESLPAPIAYI